MHKRWLIPSTYFQRLRRGRSLSCCEERNCLWGLPRWSYQGLGPRNEDPGTDIGHPPATGRRPFHIPRIVICRRAVSVDSWHGPLLGT